MHRGWLLMAALVVVMLAVGGYFSYDSQGARRPIVVGILHSKTGALKEREKPMIEAEVMALEEINAEGGLLGREVKWVSADGRSNPSSFAQEARRLIDVDKVSAIFGCYASPCRKAVKPVVEEGNNLLFYPAAYEGLELSPNIVYTGGPANQQVVPAVSWAIGVLKARTFFLVGSDTVRSHVVSALAADSIKALGASTTGEEYLAPQRTDVEALVAKIKQAGPDVVLNSLEGETNAAFFEGLARGGLSPEKRPVISFGISEEELRALPVKFLAGHYAAWNYVQSIDRRENREFISRFKKRNGPDSVTNDAATTAYNSVRLWAQAVTEGGTDQVTTVRKMIRRQSLDAPEGVVSVDDENLHNWRPFFMGKIRPDGQFEIVSSIAKPIEPIPYPWTRLRTEWDSLLTGLAATWGGEWSGHAAGAAR